MDRLRRLSVGWRRRRRRSKAVRRQLRDRRRGVRDELGRAGIGTNAPPDSPFT